MSQPSPRAKLVLLLEAQKALHMTTKKLAEALGFSERTGQRWYAKQSTPSGMTMNHLARLVHPVDERLAAEIAASAGSTLEGMGLVRPAPPPEPALPPAAAPAPPLPADALADLVLCAAARAANVPPDAQRGAVLAAFERARALRMTVEDVLDALTPKTSTGRRGR